MKYTLLSLLAVLFLSIPSHAALDPIVVAEDLRQPEAKGITEALKSDRPQQRARAALALGRIRSPLGINPLLMLLTDKNYGVRREAVFALGQYGWEAQASGGREKEIAYKIKELLENEGSIPVRIVALEALGKIGLLETPKLVIPHLKDESGPVQAEAIMALYRYRLVAKLRKPDVVLEDIPKEAIDQFAVLVDAVEYPVRRNLAYFFARVKDARGATILAKLSLDSDRWIKMFAIMGLTKIADPASLSTFLKATNDRSSEVQIAALAGVVAVKGEGKLDKDLALELNHHVRTAFAQTLATVPEQVPGGPVDPSAILSGGQADELISKLMSDRSPQVQAAALQSFAKRKKALAKAILTQVISKSNWVMKEAAVQMVGVLGGEQTPLLKLALKDKNVNVRNAALGNLSSITEGWAFDAIVTATLSKELSERGTAIDALTSRKEDAKVDYAMKAYVNSAGQKWIETREMIVELIRQVPGDVTTKHLFTMLKDPAQSVQARAHQALLDRGIKDLPALPAPVLTHTPYKELEFNNAPIVVLKTSKGDIWIATNPRDAQIHVANFVGYAKAGKYNKLPFHRVVSNFVVQGGDPDKSGWGDAGWAMRAEINHQPFLRGTVGMPRAQGFDTGGIQIFINHVPTPHLDGQYTVFGQVIMGLDVIDRLERGDLILETQVM